MADKIVIGVDPDSKLHGVATYLNGKLIELESLSLVGVIEKINELLNGGYDIEFAIENVMANQMVYSRNRQSSKAAESKVAMNIGRCQQAQVELCRVIEHYGINCTLYRPCGRNFADDSNRFHRLTGWQKSSNEDQRSAAYFGLLHIQQKSMKRNS